MAAAFPWESKAWASYTISDISSLEDDFLVDELASQGNEEGCICIRALGGTEHEHEGPPIT